MNPKYKTEVFYSKCKVERTKLNELEYEEVVYVKPNKEGDWEEGWTMVQSHVHKYYRRHLEPAEAMKSALIETDNTIIEITGKDK